MLYAVTLNVVTPFEQNFYQRLETRKIFFFLVCCFKTFFFLNNFRQYFHFLCQNLKKLRQKKASPNFVTFFSFPKSLRNAVDRQNQFYQNFLHQNFFLTRGLYYKTFYGSNFYGIIISQSVCNSQSLLPQTSICRQCWSLLEWSPFHDSTQMGCPQTCPEILDQGRSSRHWKTLQLITIWQKLLP